MPTFYQPRAQLTDASWFYGRKQELGRLFSYLNKPNPQNVSIVGQRRIGKSWLLKTVALDASLRKQYLEEPEKYTFIYWDLQCEHQLSPELFFRRMIELLLANLSADLREVCQDAYNDNEPEDSLLDMLDLLEFDGYRVVLLLDEFAAITRNSDFAESFFSHLRSIFSRPAMTCVTASYRSLGEMCHLGPDSPFFNIFSRIQLGLFSKKEAEGFIIEPFEAAGVTLEPGVTREILRLTGYHPCFISQLCNDLARGVQAGSTLTKELVYEHNGPFQTSVFDDYGYYWQRLDEDEQAMLRSIAEGNQPATLEHPVFIRLRDLGLIGEDKAKPVPFSVPFGQFIQESKGTDIYFEKAFSDTDMTGPDYMRIAEIMLAAAKHIPDITRGDLEEAIRTMQGRPQDAMRICGRDVLDLLLEVVARRGAGIRYNARYQKQSDIIRDLEPEAYVRNRIPKSYLAHLSRIKDSGNYGSHERDACTPASAFLTVLETIHLAEEVGKRYGA